MKKVIIIGCWIATVSATMTSCQSPEGVARKIAAKSCDCGRLKDIVEDQLVREVELREITDTEKLEERRNALHESGGANLCLKEVSELFDQSRIDFAKDDDRHTIYNLASALEDQCSKERYATKKKADPIDALYKQQRN